MTTDAGRAELRRALLNRVGGFFRNTRAIPGVTCEVCSGAAAGTTCIQCEGHRRRFGAALADRVVTLTYVRGGSTPYHQSAHTMWAYKQSPPSTKAAEDLALMIVAASYCHGDCARRVSGRAWDAVTFVPSVDRPGSDHPAAALARSVVGLGTDHRFPLALGAQASEADRTVLADRFVVEEQWLPRVVDRHVLVVDDTWTSGSKAQSAALAVRAAGAEMITVLCVARWCRQDWPDHRALLDACTEPYDAWVCPVTRAACPT